MNMAYIIAERLSTKLLILISILFCSDLGFSVAPADMKMIKGLSCRQLDTATYRADVSIGCSNRPQFTATSDE